MFSINTVAALHLIIPRACRYDCVILCIHNDCSRFMSNITRLFGEERLFSQCAMQSILRNTIMTTADAKMLIKGWRH